MNRYLLVTLMAFAPLVGKGQTMNASPTPSRKTIELPGGKAPALPPGPVKPSWESVKNYYQVGSGFGSILKFTRLRGAVIAQFFYVGAQVCVASFFINVARKAVNMDERTASEYLGYGYGSAFVLGRFAGTFLMKFYAPARLLGVYALINIALSAFVIFSSGFVVIVALIGISFFMSIMFPTIFALGIKDLNNTDTKMGSSLIIMAIVGGAVLPLLLGKIADISTIQIGYLIPLICFIVVAWYGFIGSKVIVSDHVKSPLV